MVNEYKFGSAGDIRIGCAGIMKLGTQTSPITLTTDEPYGLDVQTEALTALTAGATGVSCGIHSRYEVDFDQTNQIGFIAVEGQLRVKKDLADGSHAAIRGYVEVDGSPALGSVSTTTLAAGHFSLELGAGTTLTDDLWLCGAVIDANVESAISVAAAKFVGLRFKKTSGSLNFETGIDIVDADVGVSVALGTTGFTTSGSSLASTARAAKFQGSVAASNYGDGYGFVESELSLTGAVAGHTAALTSWVNMETDSTITAGGIQICAQNNGIWEGASTSLANATMIFGMRMQYVVTDTNADGVHLFSSNVSGDTVDSIFFVNGGSDLGQVTNAGSALGELIPIYKTASGTTKYVKLYDHT